MRITKLTFDCNQYEWGRSEAHSARMVLPACVQGFFCGRVSDSDVSGHRTVSDNSSWTRR